MAAVEIYDPAMCCSTGMCGPSVDPAGAHLDEHGRALLVEDLRSPCTEEIGVFHAFARTVAAASNRFVVVATDHAERTVVLPWRATAPVGAEQLTLLAGGEN